MVNILFCSIWLITHPVHVSLLSIDYVPGKESVNIFLKIYYDDFLLDSGHKAAVELNMDSIGNNSAIKDVISRYTNEKVNIIINDKVFCPNLEKYNLTDNELSMNMSFNIDKKISTITVRNLILTSIYNDQANMVIVRVDDFEEGVKLTSDNTEQTFNIGKQKKE